MSRVDDIVGAWEERGDLIARGFSEGDADAAIAFRTFMARAANRELKPTEADEQYQRGALTSRAYLEQVAPEELR